MGKELLEELVGITRNKIEYIKKQPKIDWVYLKYYEGVLDLIARLESIDKAIPTQALEELEQLAEMADNCWVSCDVHKWKNTIKNYILKAQTNDEILQKFYQQGITLDSVRTLNEENANYKRVLELIKKKCVSIWHLMKSKTVEDYNFYLVIEGIEDTKIFELTQEEFDLLKRYFNDNR